MDWKIARKRMHCDCSIHDVVSSVLEYLIITPMFAIAYLAVKVPWMLFVIKLDENNSQTLYGKVYWLI